MIIFGVCVNIGNFAWNQVVIHRTLVYLTDRGYSMNSSTQGSSDKNSSDAGSSASSESGDANSSDNVPSEDELNEFSSEFYYSARYFMVTFDSTGEVKRVSTKRIARVSEKTAEKLAKNLVEGRRYGHVNTYYYLVSKDDNDDTTTVVFLDCTTQIRSVSRVFFLSIIICCFALLLIYLLTLRFSKIAVQPEVENLKRQKQFITNASHELKTPLAVIRANTEVEEMVNGENEWTRSTMKQVDRLNGLVQNLVMISRSEEQETDVEITDIDVTQAVLETIDPFRPLAQQDEKKLVCDLEAGVRMKADASEIRQLTSLLTDNAIKYCDDSGTVKISLRARTGRKDLLKKESGIRLVFSNHYAEGANVDYTRFFDRFYREDKSHNNTEKGGYGIGLSVAEKICQHYHGSIKVSWKNGIISFVCLLNDLEDD